MMRSLRVRAAMLVAAMLAFVPAVQAQLAVGQGAAIWRDFAIDGVPSSGAWNPQKQQIRSWTRNVESAFTTLQAGQGAGFLAFDTLAHLNAALAYPANTGASVYADGTPSNNGIYAKAGASGTGSWSKVSPLIVGNVAPLAVGTLTYGGDFAVSITGPATAPLLNLTMPGNGPAGPQGPIGATGPTGPAGPSAYAGTSTTSNAISTAVPLTYGTQSGLAYVAGQRLRIVESGATAWVEGPVTSYSGTSLVVTPDLSSGAGTFTSWNITVAGQRGATGATGSPGASGGSIVVSPDYANAGGQGDRKTGNIVVVTASSGLLQQGAASNLVDGSTTASSANAVQFNAVTVSSAYWLLFDLGAGAQKVITEATWAQSSAGFSHGVWQWQGTNDAVSFTNIGGTFTLGGSTAQVISTLSANQTGYRYYRLLGVSGTASGGGWNTEITFKVGSTIIDAPPPIGLSSGTFAVTQALADHSTAVATDAFVWNAMGGVLTRQSAQTAFNKDDLSGVVVAMQGDTTPDSATMPGTLGILHPVPFPVDGTLQEIDIRMAAAGTGRFMIRDIERGDIVWSSGTITLAAGVNQIVSGRDIAFRRVKATQQLLFQTISGAQLRTGAAGSGTTQYYSSPSLDVGGTLSIGALTAYTNAFSISYTLSSLYASQPAPIRPRRNLLFQQFPGTSTPAGWTIASPFSVSNGLVAAGTGGWDKVAFYGQYTGAHELQGSAQFTVTDTASIFGLAMKPNPAGAAFYGGVVQVDGTANRLGIYSWTGSATAGTLLSDVAMPALTAGHVYVLKWVRDELTITGTLTDTTAGVTTTVTWSFTSGSTAGLFAGAPGVMHRSGSGVTWNWVQLDLNVGQRVKVLFVGDSNMMGNVSPAIGRTWPMRFSDRRADKDMLISAVGSDTGQWINSRQTFDLNALSRVDYVVIAIGSNYASQATWRTDVVASIAAARAKGAEPILCTQIPSAAPATALNQAMNADILGGYFGDLRILDIAAVVTTSGDRINWASGMGQADNIHISKAGHMAVDAYIAGVAPYLLKDAM